MKTRAVNEGRGGFSFRLGCEMGWVWDNVGEMLGDNAELHSQFAVYIKM